MHPLSLITWLWNGNNRCGVQSVEWGLRRPQAHKRGGWHRHGSHMCSELCDGHLGKGYGRQHEESEHRKQKWGQYLGSLLTLRRKIHTRCLLGCHHKHIWPRQCVHGMYVAGCYFCKKSASSEEIHWERLYSVLWRKQPPQFSLSKSRWVSWYISVGNVLHCSGQMP